MEDELAEVRSQLEYEQLSRTNIETERDDLSLAIEAGRLNREEMERNLGLAHGALENLSADNQRLITIADASRAERFQATNGIGALNNAVSDFLAEYMRDQNKAIAKAVSSYRVSGCLMFCKLFL